MFNVSCAGPVIDQAAPTQTTLGVGLFKNCVDEIVPLGPSDLAGTVEIGDTGLRVHESGCVHLFLFGSLLEMVE